VSIALAAGSQLTVSPGSLVFTPANWSVPQTVAVSAANDAVAEGPHAGAIVHSATSADPNYNGLAIADLAASIIDDDVAGVIVAESGGATAVAEGGAGDAYTIVLTSQPVADVAISLSAGGQVSISPTALQFTAANWSVPQTVTVAAVNDGLVEGNHADGIAHVATSADANYQGISVAGVNVSIADNDVAGPHLRTGVLTGVTNAWRTVTLDRSYASMVVVASVNYSNSSIPLVARVRRASGNTFQVRVDRTDHVAGSFPGVTVQYVVAEAGVYTIGSHGVKMEAMKFTSTVTDRKGSYGGQTRTYRNAYSLPVVIGQVMSANDPDWSVFWARGASSTQPPSATRLRVGKHVGEDSDITRSSETVGYMVFESGTGSIDGVGFTAAVGSETIRGVGNAPPYAYTLSGLATASTAIVSQAGMIGSDGGWPVLYGGSPLSATRLNLAIDEDARDAERSHGAERVAYVVFGTLPSAAARVAAVSVASTSPAEPTAPQSSPASGEPPRTMAPRTALAPFAVDELFAAVDELLATVGRKPQFHSARVEEARFESLVPGRARRSLATSDFELMPKLTIGG
jgi:hypothetical protein